MKIFLTWSGTRSREVAQLLYDWLPQVIQAIEPQFSPHLEKGAKWITQLDEWLEETSFGIAILTPENLRSEWLHYEVGALSKQTADARVCTFLIGLTPSDVALPLSKFQHTGMEKADIFKLVSDINRYLATLSGGNALTDERLKKAFETGWNEFDQKLKALVAKSITANATNVARSESDILEELLETVREMRREQLELSRNTIQRATKEDFVSKLKLTFTGLEPSESAYIRFRRLIPRELIELYGWRTMRNGENDGFLMIEIEFGMIIPKGITSVIEDRLMASFSVVDFDTAQVVADWVIVRRPKIWESDALD